jgi:hypothetical protein
MGETVVLVVRCCLSGYFRTLKVEGLSIFGSQVDEKNANVPVALLC